MEWKSTDLSHELSLTCGVNVNYYKSVHQAIPTRENREHPGNFQKKSLSSAFNWVLPFYFLKWNRYFSACKQKFLESTSQFSFKFCINLQCHQTLLLYTIFQLKHYILWSNAAHQSANFWDFWVLGSKFIKVCQLWNNKSIPLPVLHLSSFPWQLTPL